ADHVLSATVGLGALPSMAGASLASRRLSPRVGGLRRLLHAWRRSTAHPSRTISGVRRRTSRWQGPTGVRLLAKEQDAESLQAERRLLQGKQQPKIPLEHQVQHAPIGRRQGILCEPLAQRLTLFAAELDLFGAFHRRRHPYEQQHV